MSILKESFSLTKKQAKIIEFDRQEAPLLTICEGAIGSGKTTGLLWLWVLHVGSYEGQNKTFMITGATISSIKRNILDELYNHFGIDTTLNTNNEFIMFGNKVVCFGTQKISDYRAMKGFNAYGWLGNEITEHHPNSVDQAFKRCRGEGCRYFWDTNPDAPSHYIKKRYIDKSCEKMSNGRIRVKSWHFVLDDNEYLSEEYKENLKESIPSGHLYDRDILGLWVTASGMIYKDFNYDIHVIEGEDNKRLIENRLNYWFCGVDWGYEHLGVILLLGRDYDGNIYVLEEIAERHKTIDWWKAEQQDIKDRFGTIPFYCDDARPDYVYEFQGIPANKAVIEGITYVSELLKNNKLFIFDNCRNLLKEIYEYSWNERAGKEQPIKENDDSMDCLRYAVYTERSETYEFDEKLIGAVEIFEDYRL